MRDNTAVPVQSECATCPKHLVSQLAEQIRRGEVVVHVDMMAFALKWLDEA